LSIYLSIYATTCTRVSPRFARWSKSRTTGKGSSPSPPVSAPPNYIYISIHLYLSIYLSICEITFTRVSPRFALCRRLRRMEKGSTPSPAVSISIYICKSISLYIYLSIYLSIYATTCTRVSPRFARWSKSRTRGNGSSPSPAASAPPNYICISIHLYLYINMSIYEITWTRVSPRFALLSKSRTRGKGSSPTHTHTHVFISIHMSIYLSIYLCISIYMYIYIYI